jgi:hypothetical protein
MKHYLGIELRLADFEITHWLFWQNEWWKPILNYEGLYEVSSLGRIKSLKRFTNRKKGTKKQLIHEKYLKPGMGTNGYLGLGLTKDGKTTSKMIHRLVIEAFYGRKELTVNHKKLGNKLDNRLQNLEYSTQRENSQHYFASKKFTSDVTGVSYNKKNKVWRVFIRFLGKQYYLGMYKTEQKAVEIQSKYFPRIINAETKEQVIEILKELNLRKIERKSNTPTVTPERTINHNDRAERQLNLF